MVEANTLITGLFGDAHDRAEWGNRPPSMAALVVSDNMQYA